MRTVPFYPFISSYGAEINFFPITFATGTAKQTQQGRDMFFPVKEGQKWLVAADQFPPGPPQARSAGS